MLNKEFVRRKISLIQEDLEGLQKVKKHSIDEVIDDLFVSMTAERLLERIVTRAIDINRHLIAAFGSGSEKIRTNRDTFTALAQLNILNRDLAKKIAPSASLRNILVHEYDDVDEQIIVNSVSDALPQYSEYCKSILDYLEK